MPALANNDYTLVGNVASKTLPKSLKAATVFTAARSTGLLAQMLGLFDTSRANLPVSKDSDGYRNITSERFKVTEGWKFSIHVAATYPEPRVLSNGVAETQLITPNYDGNLFARHDQVMTHYKQDIIIPESEITMCRGDVRMAEDIVQAHFAVHAQGSAIKLQKDMWADTEQGESSIAGIQRIVNTTANQYLIDGSTYTYWNANTQSQGGAFNNLDKLNLLQTNIRADGGNADIGAMNENEFSWMRKRLEDVGNLATWYDTLKFGGEALIYGPTKFTLDTQAPTGCIYLFTSARWYMWSMRGPDVKGWQDCAPYLENAGHGVMSFRLGLGCTKRNENGVLTGMTVPTN